MLIGLEKVILMYYTMYILTNIQIINQLNHRFKTNYSFLTYRWILAVSSLITIFKLDI
jgi:hypothetical protein